MDRAEVEAIIRSVLRSQIQSYFTPDSIPASAVRADPAGAVAAEDVSVADSAGNFAGANVETVLAEVATDIDTVATDAAAALATHGDSADHDERYYTEAEVDAMLTGLAVSGHNHDDRYYTEAESDALFAEDDDTKVPDMLRQAEVMGTTAKAMTPYGPGVSSNYVLFGGEIILVPILVREGQTISGVSWGQGTSGVYTASNNNKLGLYTSDGTNLTKVAETANDGNLWAGAANSTKTRDFVTPWVCPSTQVCWVAFLYSSSAQTTAPSVSATAFLSGAMLMFDNLTTNGERLPMGFLASPTATDLPASVPWTSFSPWRTPPVAVLY